MLDLGRRFVALDEEDLGPPDPDCVPEFVGFVPNSALIEVGPVEALEVADPELSGCVSLDHGVAAGGHIVLDHDVVLGRATDGNGGSLVEVDEVVLTFADDY